MASPDFREYVDLTLFDRQPRDIYDEAVENARSIIPELQVRAGTLEDALFQAMAVVGGELVASINRLPNGLMEGILSLMGFPRIEATYGTGTATFTLVDSSGGVIKAGTQIGYTETADGLSTFHTFRTVEDVTIASGSSTSAAVDIISDNAGTKPALLSGQSMVVVSASNRILSSALASDLVSGVASESDIEYFARGATFLASLSSSLTTASQMRNYILTQYANAHRCNVYDLTKTTTIAGLSDLTRSSSVVTATVNSGHGVSTNDIVRVVGAVPTTFNGTFTVTGTGATTITWAQTGTNTSTTTDGTLYHFDSLQTDLFSSPPADQPGYAVIFVGAEDGSGLASASKTEIVDDVTDRTVAGLTLDILDPIVVPITVTVTIRTKPGFSTLTVADDVDAYLTDLLSPATWDWSSRIRKNYIIARITTLTGVDYVDTLTFAVGSGYEQLADVDDGAGGSFDLFLKYKGSLPSATVTVSEA